MKLNDIRQQLDQDQELSRSLNSENKVLKLRIANLKKHIKRIEGAILEEVKTQLSVSAEERSKQFNEIQRAYGIYLLFDKKTNRFSRLNPDAFNSRRITKDKVINIFQDLEIRLEEEK